MLLETLVLRIKRKTGGNGKRAQATNPLLCHCLLTNEALFTLKISTTSSANFYFNSKQKMSNLAQVFNLPNYSGVSVRRELGMSFGFI